MARKCNSRYVKSLHPLAYSNEDLAIKGLNGWDSGSCDIRLSRSALFDWQVMKTQTPTHASVSQSSYME